MANTIHHASSKPTSVLITIDVECSMGGAWGHPGRRPVSPERRMLCRNENGEWGTRFLAGELSHYGLTATFFTEMFSAEVFGEAPLRQIVRELSEAGQDVQLHLHPIFLRYMECLARSGGFPPPKIGGWPDSLASYDEVEQRNLIDRGASLFRGIVGRDAVTFRAGGYMANRTTLRALAGTGIRFDSSANPACEHSFPGDAQPPNQTQLLEGVWEIPVTVARTHAPDTGMLKHLEVSALSFGEVRNVLKAASRVGVQHVVLVFHSFSAVKARDFRYEQFRPDRIAIGRWRRLLRFLAENPSTFRVRTFADLVGDNKSELTAARHAGVPDLGFVRPFFRKAVQGVNRLYWV